MQKKHNLKKIVAVCILATFMSVAPALAASEQPGRTSASKPGKQNGKIVIMALQDARVAASQESPLLEFADNLFLERKIVTPHRGVQESKWSITPTLNRVTLSSLDDSRNLGLVWKYRF